MLLSMEVSCKSDIATSAMTCCCFCCCWGGDGKAELCEAADDEETDDVEQ
jgi:hypothetical protein